jgi:hypothetical protein
MKLVQKYELWSPSRRGRCLLAGLIHKLRHSHQRRSRRRHYRRWFQIEILGTKLRPQGESCQNWKRIDRGLDPVATRRRRWGYGEDCSSIGSPDRTFFRRVKRSVRTDQHGSVRCVSGCTTVNRKTEEHGLRPCSPRRRRWCQLENSTTTGSA